MPEFTLPQGDLLIAPEKASWVEAALTQLAQPEFVQHITQKVNASTEDEDEDFWDDGLRTVRPYQVRNGVLSIPVRGVLLSGFPYQFFGYATGYEYVTAAVARGAADPAVREIVLDINSPGGTVSGCFECADSIYNARGSKPIRAVANEFAYSAAYALASSADSINVTRTGGVGSIGVIAAHMEMSKRLEQMGVKITLVYAGERKADGHPALPLSKEAQASMQKRVDALYDIFVATVARNRALDEKAVRATEADAFMAREAVENGLADAVGPLDILSAFAEQSPENEDDTMSKDTPAVDQAAHEAAVAEATAAATEAGKAEGRAEGATAERERVKAILQSDEGKARPKAALHVALNSAMSAEDATAFLSGLDEEKSEAPAPAPATGRSQFEAAMETGQNPELGVDGGEELSFADGIFASVGAKPVK